MNMGMRTSEAWTAYTFVRQKSFYRCACEQVYWTKLPGQDKAWDTQQSELCVELIYPSLAGKSQIA